MIRSLAARVFGLSVKANTTARHGMALISSWLQNILWNIDNTWGQLVKQTYGRNAVVYACVRILCTSVPEAPLKCYAEKGDERIELPKTHPLRQLIRRPNELMTEYEMMELAVIQLAVVGRTVWWKERSNGGKPIALWPLRPDRVGPVYSVSDAPGERVLAGWAYLSPGEGTPVLIPRRDAFTINFPDPDGESGGIVEGLGPLSVLRYEVAADNKATDHVGALLANYAQPGVVLEVENSPTPEEAAIMKARFRQEFGGERIGVPAIVGAGTKITPLGFSLKDLEFPGLRANAEARICGVMGVPPILAGVHVGLVESSQRANTKELRELFAETTVASYWRRFADQFTEDLAAEFDEGIVCEFDTSGVKALAGQFAEHLAPWKEAVAGAYITVNEYRTKLGVDPLPLEIGDVLYVPTTVTAIPATEAARAAFDKQQKLQAAAQDAAEAKLLEQQGEQLALPPGEAGEEDEEEDITKAVKHGGAHSGHGGAHAGSGGGGRGGGSSGSGGGSSGGGKPAKGNIKAEGKAGELVNGLPPGAQAAAHAAGLKEVKVLGKREYNKEVGTAGVRPGWDSVAVMRNDGTMLLRADNPNLTKSFHHEFAHALDPMNASNAKYKASEDPTWLAASGWKESKTGKYTLRSTIINRPTSEYGKSSPWEDFAESFATYTAGSKFDRRVMQGESEKRYEYMQKFASSLGFE